MEKSATMLVEMIKKFGLRVTQQRVLVLKQFFDRPNNPMSVDELLVSLPSGFDRVTAYRIVNCLADKGIVEKTGHFSNTLKFILSPSVQQKHEHLVTCRVCGLTTIVRTCVQSGWRNKLDHLGFTDVSHNLSFTGVCAAH